jgi:hypothetical protein
MQLVEVYKECAQQHACAAVHGWWGGHRLVGVVGGGGGHRHGWWWWGHRGVPPGALGAKNCKVAVFLANNIGADGAASKRCTCEKSDFFYSSVHKPTK